MQQQLTRALHINEKYCRNISYYNNNNKKERQRKKET